MHFQDPLFSLIKSMSKSEKRHFKVYANRHIRGEQNQYIVLFDVLNNMKAYDKTLAMEAVAMEKRGTKEAKNFSAIKRYLMDVLLTSLSVYKRTQSIEGQLKEQISHIKILLERAIYKEADKLIQKAKKQAEKYQYLHHLDDLLRLEKKNVEHLYPFTTKKYEEKQQAVFNKIAQCQQEIQLLDEVEKLHIEFTAFVSQKGRNLNLIPQHILEPIKNGKITAYLQHKNLHISSVASDIVSLYYMLQHDFKAAFKHLHTVQQSYTTHRYLLQENYAQYLNFCNNYLMKTTYAGEFHALKNSLQFMASLSPQTPNDEEQHFHLYHYYLLAYFTNTADFDMAELNTVARAFAKKEKQIPSIAMPRFLAMFFMLSICYFLLGKYKEAVRWVNKLLNNKDRDVLKKGLIPIMAYRLLIFYESEDWDTIEHLLRQTKRAARKLNMYPKFCQIVFHFFEQQFNITSSKDKKQSCQELHDNLLSLYQQKEEVTAVNSFNITTWAQAQTEERTMAEMIRLGVEDYQDNMLVKKS